MNGSKSYRSGKYLVRITAAAVFLLASSTVSAGPPPGGPGRIQPDGQEKVIRWFSYTDHHRLEGQKKLVGQFQRATGISVAINNGDKSHQRAKLLEMMGEDRPPELMIGDTDMLSAAIRMKGIVPIKQYVKGETSPDVGNLSGVSRGALQAWTHLGELWGVPYSFSPVVMFYNQSLFDKAGLHHPSQDWEDRAWNMQAFLETAKKLTRYDASGKIISAGIDSPGPYVMWPWYYGGDWADANTGKSRLTSQSTVKAIQEMADLGLKQGLIHSGGFNAGISAMTIQPSWYAATLKGADVKWNLAAVPWSGDHSVPVYVDAFGIGSDKGDAEAASFVRWVRNDSTRLRKWLDNDSGGYSVPADKELFSGMLDTPEARNSGVRLRVVVDALDYSKPINLHYNANWFKLDTMISEIIEQAMTGEKKAKDLLKAANSQFSILLKEPAAQDKGE